MVHNLYIVSHDAHAAVFVQRTTRQVDVSSLLVFVVDLLHTL